MGKYNREEAVQYTKHGHTAEIPSIITLIQ